MLLATSLLLFGLCGKAYNYDYQLIENWADSKTSCSQDYRNEWACRGYGNEDESPCNWESCKQHCDESEYCLFFFTNENMGCHLYGACDDTRSTAHVGNTWARIVGGKALHTEVMDLTPKALAALQGGKDDPTLAAPVLERPDKVGMWVVIAVMVTGVLTICGLVAWKKFRPEWKPFVPNAEKFEAYGKQQPDLKHSRLEDQSYQNQDPEIVISRGTNLDPHHIELGQTSEVYF